MTEAQQHIIEIVRLADSMRPADLMELHNEAMGRLAAKHERDFLEWQAERDDLTGRVDAAHVRNFDLSRKIERQQTNYFLLLLVALCCVLWGVTR